MTRTVSWKKTRRINLARWLIVPRGFPAILLILAMIYATMSEADAGKRSARMLLRATGKNDGSDESRKATGIETRLRKQTTTSEASTEKKSPISPALGAFLHNVLRAQDQLKWIDHAARHAVEKEKQQKFATRSLRSLRGPFHRSRSRIRSKRRFDSFAESQETTTAVTNTDDDDEASNGEPERFWLDEDMQFKRSADFFDPDGRSYRKSRRKQERSADEGPAVDDSTLKQWARQEGLRYPGDWLAFHDNSRKDDDIWSNGEDGVDLGEPAVNTFRRQRDAPAVTRRKKMAAEEPSTENSLEIQPSLASLRKTVLEMSRSLGENDKELDERNASAPKIQESREASKRDRDVSSGAAEDVDRGYRHSMNKDSNPDEFRSSARSHRNARARRNGYHQPSLGNDRISSGANPWNDPVSAEDRFDINGQEDDSNDEDDDNSDDESSEVDDTMRRLKRERHDNHAATNARVYRRVGFRGSHLDKRDYKAVFPRLERQADSIYRNEADRRKRRSAITETRAVEVDKSKNETSANAEKKFDEIKETAVKAGKIAIEDDDSKDELSGHENDKSSGENSSASRIGFEGRREDGKQNLVGDENRDDSSANQATIEPKESRSIESSGKEAVDRKESERNAVTIAETFSPIVAEEAKEIEKSEPTDEERHKVSDSDKTDENKTGPRSEKGIDAKSSSVAEDPEGSDDKISETRAADEIGTKDNFGELGSGKNQEDRVQDVAVGKIDREVHPEEGQSKEEKRNSEDMSIAKEESSALDDARSRIAIESKADEDKTLGRRETDDENQLRILAENHKRDGRKEERESNRKRTKERDKRSDDRHFHGDRTKEAKNGEGVGCGKKVKRNSKNEAKIADERVSKVASGENGREEVEIAKDEENPISAVDRQDEGSGMKEENRGESDLNAVRDARQSMRGQEAGRKLLGRQFFGGRIISDPRFDNAEDSQRTGENFGEVVVSRNSNSQAIFPEKLEESAENVEKESVNGRKLVTRYLMSATNEDNFEQSRRRRSSKLETVEGGGNRGVRKDNASESASDLEENSDYDDASIIGGDYSEESVGKDMSKRYVKVDAEAAIEENQDDEEGFAAENMNDPSSSDLSDDYYDGLVDEAGLENFENDNEDEDRSATDLRGREQSDASFDLSDRDPIRDKVNLLIKQKLKDRSEGRIAHSKGKLAQPAEIVQYYDYDDEPGEIDSDSSIFDYNQRFSADKDCSDGSCKSSGKVPVKKNKYEEELNRRKSEKDHLKKPQHEFIAEGDMYKTTAKSKNMTSTSVKPESHPSKENSSHTTENPEKKGVSEEARGERPERHENVTRKESNLRSGGISDNDAVDDNLTRWLAQHQEHHEAKEYEKHVEDESSKVLDEPMKYSVNVRGRIEPGTIGGLMIDKLPAEGKTVDREGEKSRDSYTKNDPKRSYHVAESRSSIEDRDDLDHRNYTNNEMKDDEIPKRENGRRYDSKSLADKSDRRDQRHRISERRRDAAHNSGVSTTSVHHGPLVERQSSKIKRNAKELSTKNADFAEDSLPTMLDRSGTELDTDERTYLVVPPAREQSSSIRNAKNSSSSGSNYLALKMTDDLFKGGTEQSNPPEDKIPEPLPIVPATTEWQIIRTPDAKARVQLTDVKNLLMLDPILLTVAKSHGEFSQNFKSPVSEVQSVELDSSRQFGSNSEDVVHESFVEPADVVAEWEDETRPIFGRGLKAIGSMIGSNDGISSARNQNYTRKIPDSMKIRDRDFTNETRGAVHDFEAGEPPVDKYLKNKQNGFEDEELIAKNAEGAFNGDEKINLAKDGGLVTLGEKIYSDHRAQPKLYRSYETNLNNELQKMSPNDETRSANEGDAKRGLTNIEEWQISASTFEEPNQLSSPDTIESTGIGENVTNLEESKNLGVSNNLGVSKNLGVGKNLGAGNSLGGSEHLRVNENLGVNKNLGVGKNLGAGNNLGGSEHLGVNENLGASDNLGVSKNLGVGKNLGVSNNLGVGKHFEAGKNLGVSRNLGVNENLGVSDNLGVNEYLGAGKNLGVNENLGVSDNLGVSEYLGAGKNLGVNENLGVSDNLGVSEYLEAGKNLGVTENLEVSGNLGVSENLGVSGNLGVSKNLKTNESRQLGGRHADKSSDTELLHVSPKSNVDVVDRSNIELKSVDAESNDKANVDSKVALAMLNTKIEDSSDNANAKDYQRTRRETDFFDEHSAQHWFNENSGLRQANHRYDRERAELSSDSRIGRDYWKKSADEINDHKHRRDRARSSWQDEDHAKWHTHLRNFDHNRHGKYGSYSERKWEPRWRQKLGWKNSRGSITKHRESSLHHNAKSLRDPTDLDAPSKNSEDHSSKMESDDVAAPLSTVHSESDKNTRSGFDEDRKARRRPALHGGRHSFRDDSTWQNEHKPEDESHKKKIKVLLAADNMEDESQMNMALHGELAGKIVEQIFDQVQKNSALKRTLGSGLDRKYKAENAVASDKTYRQGLDAEEVKHTEMMMKRVMDLLGRLVLDEVQKKTCATLPPDMQEFLQWMLGVDGKDVDSPNQQETPTTEVHDERGNQSVNDTFLFKTASTAIRDKSFDDLNKILGVLKSLIEQYNALTAAEKKRVQVVRDYLAAQLALLLKYIEAKERDEQMQRNPISDSIDAPQYENAVTNADNKGSSETLPNILISGNASTATSRRASLPRQLKFKSRPVRSSDYKKQKLKHNKRDRRKRRKHKNRHRRKREKLSPQYRKLVRRAAMLRHKRGSLYDDNWDPIDSGYEEPTIYSSSGKLTNRRSEHRNLAEAKSWSDVESRASMNADGDENFNIAVSELSKSKRKREILDSRRNEKTNVQLEPRFIHKRDASIVDSQEESSNSLQTRAVNGELKSGEEQMRSESSFPLVKDKGSATVAVNKRDVVGTVTALQPWLNQKSTDLVPSEFLKELGNKLVRGSIDFKVPLIGAAQKSHAQVDLEKKSDLSSTLSKNVENIDESSSKEDGITLKSKKLAEDEAMLLSKREAWRKDNVNQLEEVAFGKDMRGKWREEKQFKKLMALDERRDEENLKSRSNREDDGNGRVNRYPENSTSHLRDVESSTRIAAYEPISYSPLSVEVAEEISLNQKKSGDTDATNDLSSAEKSRLYTLESKINVYGDDEVMGIPEQSNVMKDLQRSPVYEVNADTSIHTSAATDVEVGSKNKDGISGFEAFGEENRSRITESEAELAPRELTASSNIDERRNEANDDGSAKEADNEGEKTMTGMEKDDEIEATSDHLPSERETFRKKTATKRGEAIEREA